MIYSTGIHALDRSLPLAQLLHCTIAEELWLEVVTGRPSNRCAGSSHTMGEKSSARWYARSNIKDDDIT